MNRRKFLLTSTATVIGAGLVAGSKGSTTTEASRTVQVSVEEDDNGYLGIVPSVEFGEEYSFDCIGHVEITLQNQTTEDPLEVETDPTVESNRMYLQDSRARTVEIGAGEEESILFPLRCPPGTPQATGTLEFEFTAGEDAEMTIEAERSLWLRGTCPAKESNGSDSSEN